MNKKLMKRMFKILNRTCFNKQLKDVNDITFSWDEEIKDKAYIISRMYNRREKEYMAFIYHPEEKSFKCDIAYNKDFFVNYYNNNNYISKTQVILKFINSTIHELQHYYFRSIGVNFEDSDEFDKCVLNKYNHLLNRHFMEFETLMQISYLVITE